MRTPALLLEDLRRRGIHLEPVGRGLRFRAPTGTLTATDRAALTQHRDELLELLRREARPRQIVPPAGLFLEHPCDVDPQAAQLRAIYETLTADEKARFAAEVAAGDSGAALVQMLMAMPAAGEA